VDSSRLIGRDSHLYNCAFHTSSQLKGRDDLVIIILCVWYLFRVSHTISHKFWREHNGQCGDRRRKRRIGNSRNDPSRIDNPTFLFRWIFTLWEIILASWLRWCCNPRVVGFVLSDFRLQKPPRRKKISQQVLLEFTVGYAAGLLLTELSLFLMKMAQPALLYLVPCSMICILCVGWRRGQLYELWCGSLSSAEDLLDPAATPSSSVKDNTEDIELSSALIFTGESASARDSSSCTPGEPSFKWRSQSDTNKTDRWKKKWCWYSEERTLRSCRREIIHHLDIPSSYLSRSTSRSNSLSLL